MINKLHHHHRPQWHYTSMAALESILEDGCIRKSQWRMDGVLVCDLAWTSSAPIWEPTANATSLVNAHWAVAVDDLRTGDTPPIARIQVDPRILFYWDSYFVRAGIPDCYRWHLAECGYACGADPNAWAVSPTAISSTAWRRVENWSGREWVLDAGFVTHKYHSVGRRSVGQKQQEKINASDK